MLSVGISGGMGSGKTFICKIFEQFGIPIYDSDFNAKKLMEENLILKEEIMELLGEESYRNDGILNRKFISKKVFNEPKLLADLNKIVHPAVYKDSVKWQQNLPKETPYYLWESAILFETGIYKNLDFNILVIAPEHVRIERIKKRDGLTEQEITGRLNQQWDDHKKIKLCDFLIENDGTKVLIPQIWDIHQILKERSLKHFDRQKGTIP